jgi:hypothetical protein
MASSSDRCRRSDLTIAAEATKNPPKPREAAPNGLVFQAFYAVL